MKCPRCRYLIENVSPANKAGMVTMECPVCGLSFAVNVDYIFERGSRMLKYKGADCPWCGEWLAESLINQVERQGRGSCPLCHNPIRAETEMQRVFVKGIQRVPVKDKIETKAKVLYGIWHSCSDVWGKDSHGRILLYTSLVMANRAASVGWGYKAGGCEIPPEMMYWLERGVHVSG